MPIISVDHLSKSYASWKKQPGFIGTIRSIAHRDKTVADAVSDMNFTIDEGEFMGFIGPNGAGKTTTLKMLSGILWPTSGSATVLGFTPWERKDEYRRQFAIVLGQKNQLWWDLPARDTFLLNKEIYEISTTAYEKRIKELGEVLGVSHLLEIPVRKLSLGERMKCELMNALLHKPKVLFLDEPTIGLDVVSQKAVRDFLSDWNKKEGTTMILTSHSMTDVQELCERVVVIDGGTIKYDGGLDRLVQKFADHKEITVTFSRPVIRDELMLFGEVDRFEPLRAIL